VAFRSSTPPREALPGAAHLHLTSQQPGTALALAEAAREAGLSVSVDPGRRLGRRDFGAVLGHDIQAESQAIRERIGVHPEGYDLYSTGSSSSSRSNCCRNRASARPFASSEKSAKAASKPAIRQSSVAKWYTARRFS